MADDNFVFNPDDNSSFGMGERPQAAGGITQFFMKITGSDDPSQVNKIMLVVAVLFFVVSAVILVIYL
jgi:hypothetical protein